MPWTPFPPLLIGLVGRAGSGKDTVGGFIAGSPALKTPTAVTSFAEPMKVFCKEVFDFTHEQLYGPSELRNAPDRRYPRGDGTCLSPREALQTLGTEWGRKCFPDVWVSLAARRARKLLDDGTSVVFTDVRFLNEALAIRALNGKLWRIRRPEADAIASAHQSERELDSEAMKSLITHEIFNTGTLDKLGVEVQEVLNRSLARSTNAQP